MAADPPLSLDQNMVERPFEINVHVAHLHKKPGHLVTSYLKIFQNNFNQTH